MRNNLIIFIPEEIPGLSNQLKLGTTSFFSVTDDSFNEEDRVELEGRNAKKFRKGSPEFDRGLFDYHKSKKIKTKAHYALVNNMNLIVIEEKALLPKDFKELKEDILSSYTPRYNVLEVTKAHAQTVQSDEKHLYFVSGKEFEVFADLLIRGSKETSTEIADPDKLQMDRMFIDAIHDNTTNLIVVNTSKFSSEDFTFYIRAGKTKKFVSQYIDLPPDEPEKVESSATPDDNESQETDKPLPEQHEDTSQSRTQKGWEWFKKNLSDLFHPSKNEEENESRQSLSDSNPHLSSATETGIRTPWDSSEVMREREQQRQRYGGSESDGKRLENAVHRFNVDNQRLNLQPKNM